MWSVDPSFMLHDCIIYKNKSHSYDIFRDFFILRSDHTKTITEKNEVGSL